MSPSELVEQTEISSVGKRVVRPYRIGTLDDLPGGGGAGVSWHQGLEIGFAEMLERGILDRPVEVIRRSYEAQPTDSGRPNVTAYRDLVDNEGVIGVAGPMTTDNCLAVLPELSVQEVPTIAICGSQFFAGKYAFTLPNGGMADEPATISAWLAGRGVTQIAVIRDYPSSVGEEYAYFFRNEARLRGQDILLERGIGQVDSQDNVDEALAKLKRTGAECLVYFGLGPLTPKITVGLKKLDWDPLRVMGTAFVVAKRKRLAHFEGWHGLDQFHEENEVFQGLLQRFEAMFGEPHESPNSVLTCGYDAARAYSIALSRMRIATGPGLRDALETVTRLPAATGAPGTVISFSKRDHRGLKGANYLFVRKVIQGEHELENVFEATAPII